MARLFASPSLGGSLNGGEHDRRIMTWANVCAFASLCVAVALPLAPASATATCAFDDGNSSLAVEGLILTRYALGLTGAPLVQNSGINAVDAPVVEAALACPSCGLNITGNPTLTVADATIISRKLAGYSGDALTNGVNLGSGTRNTPAAVQSFLLSGCGGGGTVTSITAGAGLTGGTITSTGTVAADTNYLQRRVSAVCAAGSSIRAIAADGTVTCQTDNVGSTGSSGTVTSVGAGYGLVANGPNVVSGAIVTSGLMELAYGFILPQGCAAGQIPKSDGANLWSCAPDDTTGSATNAFVQGGNAFGVRAVLGTTDGRPLTVGVGGGDGLRIARETDPAQGIAVNVVNGSGANLAFKTCPSGGAGLTCITAPAIVVGATLAGGGRDGNPNVITDSFGTVGGGYGNFVGNDNSNPNDAIGATIGGGVSNSATAARTTVVGGEFNTATNYGATVVGGAQNVAYGNTSTVLGGYGNVAGGSASVAAGNRANASHDGSFVFSDAQGVAFSSVGDNSFNVRAGGGFHLDAGTRQFFNGFQQSLNLEGQSYGIGAQAGAMYFRSGQSFCWYRGGVHVNDGNCSSGGGSTRMMLSGDDTTPVLRVFGNALIDRELYAAGVRVTSDRSLKERFQIINAKSMLAKVASLPLSIWNFKSDGEKTRHLGPMAQDFKRLFGVGKDDKTISMTDAAGVAFAAIQGLNQKLTEQVRLLTNAGDEKNEQLKSLRASHDVLLRRLDAIEKKISR